jgi:CBS domain-containing protein
MHRKLLRLLARGAHHNPSPIPVRDIMKTDPTTVTPQTSTLEAMQIMREQEVGCLPVVEDGRLAGIITQGDLIDVTTHLLQKFLRDDSEPVAGD